MTSMDIEILSREQSGHEDPTSADLNKKSNSIPDQLDPDMIIEDIDNSKEVRTTKVICLPSISNLVKSAFMFVVFTSIAMVIGILIVYYKSPKPPGEICTFVLKSEGLSSIGYDSHPHSVAVGDFNNDGRPDIVVPNSGTNNIGVFLRHGNNSFIDQMTYSTDSGSLPYAVAVGDFNNDQWLDIAVANFGTNNIGIFLGIGNGNFTPQRVFYTGSSRPRWIAVGDFNNDTRLDIVIVNYGTNNIGILLGDGNGNFADQITFSTGFDSVPYALAVADLNHDNKLDIVVANYGTNNIGVLLGLGNGSFGIQAIFNTGINSRPYSIAVNKLNNDTHMDIVVVYSGSNNVGVLLGFGNGTFTMPTTYSTGNNSFPLSVAIGDFNNDNILDIAVADYGTVSVGVFFGYGNGSFQDQMTFFTSSGSNPYSIATGDFNNDTLLDIAAVIFDHNYVDIILTYRNYSFSSQTTYPTTGIGSEPRWVVVADFNNDTRLDIAVANYWGSNVDIFLGYGDGTFSSQIAYSTGNNSKPYCVAAGDFNNDNRLDMVVANSGTDNIGVLLGYGNGSFSSQTTYFTGSNSQPWSVAVGDFNNDKRLDIVVANYGTGNIGIFLGNGDGTFSSQSTFSTGNGDGTFSSQSTLLTGNGSQPQYVAVSDLNNDSRLDIIVVNYWTANVGIFLGFGNGSFSNQTSYSTGPGSGAYSAAIGDLNNDGQQDIVVTIYFDRDIVIFLGLGNGTFASGARYSTGSDSQPYAVAIGDLNNDNRTDIVVANDISSNIVVFLGDGNGTFSNVRNYPTGSGSFPESVALGDFNGDSLLDIVVANNGTNVIGVFLGYTYMNGISESICSTGSAPHPRAVALGDFNNDTQLDVAIVNYESGNVGVLLGYTDDTFPFQTMFSTGALSFPTSLAVGDFNNDSELDITVANSGTESVGILLGFGNGSFASPVMYSTGFGSVPQCAVVGDFNNDKKLDIAVADSGTDSVFTMLKYDMGAFKSQIMYSTGTGSFPQAVSVGDFNNDGRLDFVVVNSGYSNIGICIGLDNDNFSSQTIYSTGIDAYPLWSVVEDLNNDTCLDIVVANFWGSNLGVFLGFCNGTFSNQTTYSTGYNSEPDGVAIADLNNDSLLDLVVALQYYNQMGILYGYGDGTFSNITTYSTGTDSAAGAVAVGDFNKDGRLDIVVANYNIDNIVIFYGYGNGTFSNLVSYSTGNNSNPYTVVVVDLNNDGWLDIVVPNSGTDNIGVFFGNDNGNFSEQTTFSTGIGSAPYAVGFADFNNDSQLDIAVANYGTNNLGILLSCANGTFFSQLTYLTGDYSEPCYLAIGHFNRDSRLDVIVTNSGTDNVGVFLGYFNEGFLNAPAYSTGSSSGPTSIAVADFNNDTRLDIVVANNGTENVMLLFGSGYGTFVSQTTYSTGNSSQPCWVAVGDFNNDKRLDIVVANSGTNSIGIFLGNGTNTFSSQMTYSTGVRSQPYSVAVGDFNNDTLLDIAVASYGANSVGFFLGYGNGSFMSQQIFATGFGSNPFALAVGDVNNDRLTDIVATNNGYGNIDILMKTC